MGYVKPMDTTLKDTKIEFRDKSIEGAAAEDVLSGSESDEQTNDPTADVQKKKKKRRARKKKTADAGVVVDLQPGLDVIIHGLTGAVALNGQTGTCVEFDTTASRWHVRIGNGETKALKPDNLRPKVAATARTDRAIPSAGKAGGPEEEFVAWTRRAIHDTPNALELANLSPEDKLQTLVEGFSAYKFTGPLRPARITSQMKPPPGAHLPDYALDPEGESQSEAQTNRKIIPVLEGAELETMREACRLGREVLDIASRFMRAGVTGDEIDCIVWRACADRQLYPSPLNYFGFPKSLCVSPNEVICHGIPDCRPLEEGDIVNLDISICYKGFHSDLNETFFIGKCDEESHKLVQTAYNSLRAASEMIRPGTLYRELGAAIHAEASGGGCAVVPAYCGHGVGKLFHGPPDIPHYRKNKAVGVMKPGHVFTIEPMLNSGGNNGDKTWPDDWTAVTRDGKRSAQFEHVFLVTETGCEVLTARNGAPKTAMPAYDASMFQR